MWYSKIFLARKRISLILLLLIAIRIVPFDLLHYHNNHFASFDALSSIAGFPAEDETIDIGNSSCTFHKFLSLINNGFIVEVDGELLESEALGAELTIRTESRGKSLLFEIFNKGSPLQV